MQNKVVPEASSNPAQRGFLHRDTADRARLCKKWCLLDLSKSSFPLASRNWAPTPRRRPSLRPQLRTRHPGGGKQPWDQLWLSMVTRLMNTTWAPQGALPILFHILLFKEGIPTPVCLLPLLTIHQYSFILLPGFKIAPKFSLEMDIDLRLYNRHCWEKCLLGDEIWSGALLYTLTFSLLSYFRSLSFSRAFCHSLNSSFCLQASQG